MRSPPRYGLGLGPRSTLTASPRPGMYDAAIFESLRARSVPKGQNHHGLCERITSKHAPCPAPECLYFASRSVQRAGDRLSKPRTLGGRLEFRGWTILADRFLWFGGLPSDDGRGRG